MNMLLLLFARIALGEKYERTKKEDVIIWFSFLAAFPISISVSLLLFGSLMDTAPSWGLLLIGMASILIMLGVWLGIARLRLLPIILIFAAAGWVGAYLVINP